MNTTRIGPFAVALLVAGCAGRTPAPATTAGSPDADAPREMQTDAGGIDLRTSPPPPAPTEPVEFPAYHERMLSNGAEVVIVENHEQPVVSINLRIKGGSAAEPEDGVGVASFTASLLTKGTETRTAEEIAQTIDYVGGSLGAGAGQDWMSVTATALTEHMDTALVLLEDVVENPTFPDDELETERRRTLSSLQVQLSQPQSLAQRRFMREIYGDHPYGTQLTPEAVRAIERADLQAFHEARFRMDNALFVVAGDVDPDRVVARLEERFGDAVADGAPPAAERAGAPVRSGRDLVFVHKPGTVQAVLRMGHLLEPATDPDWVALDVAMQVLGGGSTGWLFDVLREEKGYTYGAYAQGVERVGPGYFQAFAEVRNEVADSALTELIGLIERIRTGPIPAEDLRLAKDYMVGSFPLQIETPQQVAGQIASTRLLGRSQAYLENYRERVEALTAGEVQRAAREHLRPDRSVIVVVGDANALYDKLAPFGDVRLYDVEGEPITLDDISVRGSDVSFDPSMLEEKTLVYALNLQGNPLGEITTTVTREMVDGREAVHLRTRGGGAGLTLEADVFFDAATFEPISSRNTQSMGPSSMVSDLRMEDGRIVGTLSLPGQEEQAVDAEAPEGTLLPGMDDIVVWLADFEANREFTVPSFNVQGGSVAQARLEVVGEEAVTVAAGEFEAYVIEVSSPNGQVTVYARKQAPHYVLKQEPAGQPVTIELTEMR